jgi:hypothetical protein
MSVARILALTVAFPLICAIVYAQGTRPFRMGFTPWPADFSVEGMQTSVNFANAHGDIVSIMMIGGIPWPEALDNKPFSSDVQQHLAYKPALGKKLFVSIAPLNPSRDGMAPYWGEHDNMPLPPEWANLAFNDPKVKKAFLGFCVRVVDAMHPDYLAIGVEDNVLLSKNPAKWAELKELHRDTYQALKLKYPALPVFFTTDVGHYLKFAAEAKDKDQDKEVGEMMAYSDLFAMSFYPYMNLDFATSTGQGFLDFAQKFKKPIAVSESGMTSRDVTLKSYNVTLTGSEDQQKSFAVFLLNTALHDKYEFVINFATTDFEKLVEKLPAGGDAAMIWAYTGMQTSSLERKPALLIWDHFFHMSYGR